MVHRGELGDLERHRAQLLIKEISTSQRSRSIHFDEEFVETIPISLSWLEPVRSLNVSGKCLG
ncbi:hypothetical protein ACT691_05645 [Vibrio metschnikovii]